jgi:hypothetical protein
VEAFGTDTVVQVEIHEVESVKGYLRNIEAKLVVACLACSFDLARYVGRYIIETY